MSQRNGADYLAELVIDLAGSRFIALYDLTRTIWWTSTANYWTRRTPESRLRFNGLGTANQVTEVKR